MNAAATITNKQRFERVIYFFPLQLVFLHLKKNHFLLFFWVLLFGYTLNYFAARYGVAYQFLYPEYQGATNPVSFAMVGFALGGFILAFNLYTYILHGFRFPFIATLNRPFLKFSINNFILPLTFVFTYTFASISFQRDQELLGWVDIAYNVLGFALGMFLFLLLSLLYFRFTNKNVLNYEPKEKPQSETDGGDDTEMVKTNLHRRPRFEEKGDTKHEWRVETYMSSLYKVGLARSSKHYKHEILTRVFKQNHFNASFFELVMIVSFVIIGSFGDNPYFVLPAAASVLLLFTVMLMIVSILYTWVRGWTLFFFFALFFMMNYSGPRLNLFSMENHAYGLRYTGDLPEYNTDVIRALNSDEEAQKRDFLSTIQILDKWRLKNQPISARKGKKPKIVLVNTSGGGSRSATWTINSLMYADSVLDGQLLRQTAFVSGSSGGMIGAAYLRELYLKYQYGEIENLYDSEFRTNMSKDLLSPVIFSIATNDFFIRYRSFAEGDQTYTKDRAWAFEQRLNANLGGLLDKRLGDYRDPEQRALIPLFVMAPTIVNDGRRLLISSTPVSYLTSTLPVEGMTYATAGEDVEFTRMFAGQDPNNLKFTSALRMNATFPYVLPIVSLPSEPAVEVMDAGLRDNFGTKTTLQFLYTFRNWINSNTSGVVIVQIRDVERDAVRPDLRRNLVSRILAPLGSVYENFTRMQDYNNDQMIRYLSAWFDNDIDIVTFQLVPDEQASVSLSWHLTRKEKETINKALHSEGYQKAMERLTELLAH